MIWSDIRAFTHHCGPVFLIGLQVQWCAAIAAYTQWSCERTSFMSEEERWKWVCTIDAATHAEAFAMALDRLSSAGLDDPVRIEEDTEGSFRKPWPGRLDEGRPDADAP